MTTAGPRILLAEDEPHIARPLIATLGSAGHDVRWVRAIREVREALPGFLPDVLILDVTLETDGLELFQAIRFAPDHPRGGVVILTESGNVAMAERARQLGAAAVMPKPIDGAALTAVVADLLALI